MLFTPHIFMPNAGAVFALAHSLQLAAGANQYISRDITGITGGPTSTQKQTVAFWYKLASTGSIFTFYSGGPAPIGGATNSCSPISVSAAGAFDHNEYNGAANDSDVISAAQTMDTTTWHHICVAVDTTQAVAANRTHIYIDGVEVSYSASSYPALNSASNFIFTAPGAAFLYFGSVNFFLGGGGPTQSVDGKLADLHVIDGQQLTPSSFITGTGAGTCHPKAFSGGAFGIYGFHLSFSASDATDSSGNGNDWVLRNSPTFSTDVPT